MEKKEKDSNKEFHGGIEVHHERQLPRLNRIEGQVRGLGKMIENKRSCLEVCHQISAILSALRRVQTDMLRDHLSAVGEAIIAKDITPQKRHELADELAALLKELS